MKRPVSAKRSIAKTKRSTTVASASASAVSATVKRSGVYHSNDEQCAEITSGFGRCKNTITSGTTFCHLHQRKKMQHEDGIFDSTFAHVGNGLWIGSLDTANDPMALKAAGIKAVVNISGWEPRSKTRAMYKKLGIVYHTLTSRDSHGKLHYLGDEPIGPRLSMREFYNYMDRGVEMIKKSPRPVLIHCHAGINRSASLIAAYLISQHKMDFAHARHYLIKANEKRSISVLTNRDFVSAMNRYAEYLRSRNSHYSSR